MLAFVRARHNQERMRISPSCADDAISVPSCA
jgi:hypothetical protein